MQDRRGPVRFDLAYFEQHAEEFRAAHAEQLDQAERDGSLARARELVADVERARQERRTATSRAAAPPRSTPDDAPSAERPKPRFRRVHIDDGDESKPPEVLATQFPARRPNRRRSPRLTPPARPDRRTP